MKTATYFHCQLKPVSRSDGKSVVNCAAYRTGSKLEDRHYGQTRDYTHKKDVVTSFTVAPDGAPEWATDTEALWNAVEVKENRTNSILAYEFEVALPNELDDAERENITRNIAGWLRDEYGVAVTAGIHNGGDRGNGKNDHAHIFMTTREINEGGWARTKLREFNVRPGEPNPNVGRVREEVAGFINTALGDAGSDERVTPESYAARGIDIEGTKHLGPAASAMERSGIETERAALNREIIEARLAWQREQAQPETDATIERDLAQRFGDDFPAASAEAKGGAADAPPSPRSDEAPKGTPSDWDEAQSADANAKQAAPQGAEEDWKPAGSGQGSDQRAEHTAWENLAGRVRSYWELLARFARDQSSGAHVVQQPEAEAPDAGSESGKSWVERIAESRAGQAARRLLHGFGHRDAGEFAEGLKDTTAIVQDILAKGPHPASAPKAPAAKNPPPAEAPSDAGAVQAGGKAPSAFEALSASVDASMLQPGGKTVSAFDALMASRTAPRPTASPAPEPDGQMPEQ